MRCVAATCLGLLMLTVACSKKTTEPGTKCTDGMDPRTGACVDTPNDTEMNERLNRQQAELQRMLRENEQLRDDIKAQQDIINDTESTPDAKAAAKQKILELAGIGVGVAAEKAAENLPEWLEKLLGGGGQPTSTPPTTNTTP